MSGRSPVSVVSQSKYGPAGRLLTKRGEGMNKTKIVGGAGMAEGGIEGRLLVRKTAVRFLEIDEQCDERNSLTPGVLVESQPLFQQRLHSLCERSRLRILVALGVRPVEQLAADVQNVSGEKPMRVEPEPKL